MALTANILDSVAKNDPMGFFSHGRFNPKKVVDFIELKNPEVAKLSNVSTNTVRFDEKIPQQVEKHLMQIANICSIVAELLDNDINKTKLWINTSNPAIGDISPKQLIRFGKYQKLLKFVIEAKQRQSN